MSNSIEPDVGALDHSPLRELARSRRLANLEPAIRSEVRRTHWLVEHNGSAIAVDLDEGAVRSGGASDDFTELELELVKGDESDLVAAARAIADQVPVRIGVLSKAGRGFALADGSLGKVSKAGPVAVRPDMSVAEGFTVIVQSCLGHFRRNEPIVVERRQVEALHQARVAMRRLRSAFSLFKPVIADTEYEVLRQELRWFTNLLGEARNLDVYLQRPDLPQPPPPELLARREQAYDVAIEALGSKRFLALMFDLVAWLATGRWLSAKKAKRPLLPFASRRLDRMWARIAPTGDLAEIDEDSRHELRIEVKKLRYGLEFFRALYPDEAKRQKQFGAAVEDLQELLGQLNDIVTAQLFAPQMAAPARVEQAKSEEQLIAEADACLRRLRKVGPYWSTPR